jgi:hypothetical protein
MRSGYTDDLDERGIAMWRGRVTSAIRGKRGQALLRDCLAALDSMPEKVLIREELVDEDGGVCLLGAVGKHRGVADIDKIDPEEHEILGKAFDVAGCLIQEIEYINDDDFVGRDETPRRRFERVRKWVLDHLKSEKETAS